MTQPAQCTSTARRRSKRFNRGAGQQHRQRRSSRGSHGTAAGFGWGDYVPSPNSEQSQTTTQQIFCRIHLWRERSGAWECRSALERCLNPGGVQKERASVGHQLELGQRSANPENVQALRRAELHGESEVDEVSCSCHRGESRASTCPPRVHAMSHPAHCSAERSAQGDRCGTAAPMRHRWWRNASARPPGFMPVAARRISLAIGTLTRQGRSRCARVITVAKRRWN